MSDMTDDQVVEWLQDHDSSTAHQQEQDNQRWQDEQTKDLAELKLLEARQLLLDPNLGFESPEWEQAYLKSLAKLDGALRDIFLAGVEAGIEELKKHL